MLSHGPTKNTSRYLYETAREDERPLSWAFLNENSFSHPPREIVWIPFWWRRNTKILVAFLIGCLFITCLGTLNNQSEMESYVINMEVKISMAWESTVSSAGFVSNCNVIVTSTVNFLSLPFFTVRICRSGGTLTHIRIQPRFYLSAFLVYQHRKWTFYQWVICWLTLHQSCWFNMMTTDFNC